MIDTYFIYVHRRDDTNEVFTLAKLAHKPNGTAAHT